MLARFRYWSVCEQFPESGGFYLEARSTGRDDGPAGCLVSHYGYRPGTGLRPRFARNDRIGTMDRTHMGVTDAREWLHWTALSARSRARSTHPDRVSKG